MAKAPKFTGHRKGYSEIWLRESFKAQNDYNDRFRVRLPDGAWKWAYSDEPNWWEAHPPCWLICRGRGDIGKMKRYDNRYHLLCETIFLGYFK